MAGRVQDNPFPWYIGRIVYTNGDKDYIEAVNKGPYRTIEGAKKSLRYWLDFETVKRIDIVAVVATRTVAKMK